MLTKEDREFLLAAANLVHGPTLIDEAVEAIRDECKRINESVAPGGPKAFSSNFELIEPHGKKTPEGYWSCTDTYQLKTK